MLTTEEYYAYPGPKGQENHGKQLTETWGLKGRVKRAGRSWKQRRAETGGHGK